MARCSLKVTRSNREPARQERCQRAAARAQMPAQENPGIPISGNYALVTLPLRRQEVHTRMRLVVLPTLACTGRRFTFQRRLLTLWAWLTIFPNCGFFPQISQTCAMTTPEGYRTVPAKLRFYRKKCHSAKPPPNLNKPQGGTVILMDGNTDFESMTTSAQLPFTSPPLKPPADYREYAELVQQAYDELFSEWLKELASPSEN